MKSLIELLTDNEDWLLDQVIHYAKENEFARYTSTLKEAWRISIKELSATICGYLNVSSQIPQINPDNSYTDHVNVTYSVIQAERHRRRGISLGMFLGLFKYYRQTYLDLVDQSRLDKNDKSYCRLMIERIFDRIEISISVEWANLNTSQLIEELQTANRQITNEKNKYLTIFESLPTPVFLFDNDLKLVNTNHAAAQLLITDNIPGQYYYRNGTPSISIYPLEGMLRFFSSAFDLEHDSEIEIDTLLGKRYFKVKLRRMQDVSGKFDGIIVILNDITSIYSSEQHLRQSNERYQLLFNSGSDAIFVYNIDESGNPGPFIEINEIACQMLDLSKDALTQLTIYDIIEPKFRRDVSCELQEMLENNQVLHQMTFRSARETSLDVETNSRIFELGGKKSVLSIARDVTEKKRLEAEMQRLGRMHLIGEMAAGIGHELRNPMTTVRGFLQFLQESEIRENVQQYYHIMIEELDRANSIITEYLSLAKNKAVSLTEFDLNHLLNTLSPLIQSDAILSNHSVEIKLQQIPQILGDQKEIRQLVLNLCRNGLEAMESGGRLAIATSMDNESVVLTIKDNGRGIPTELQDKIGTPFFTTKNEGVGLGLAICYSIASRHSATIDFSSDSCGTTFYVKFRLKPLQR